MLRPVLLAGAAMMALPALAQSTGTNTSTTANTNPNPATTASQVDPTVHTTHTTTNDHASGTGDNTQGSTAAGIYTQVDGGVTSSATGTPGMPASTNTNVDADVSTDTSVNTGVTGQTNTMSDTDMSTGTQTRTMSNTGMDPNAQADTTSSTTMGTTAQTGTMAWNNQRMSWNFSGDIGELGDPDYGLNVMRTAYAPATSAGTSGSAQTGVHAGMGGPQDIDSNWATYARSGSMLTPLEFGTWVLDAHGHNVSQSVAAMATADSDREAYPLTQILNVTAGAFAAADVNNDYRISREELTSFMGA